MNKIPLASYIDHTLLAPGSSQSQIEKLCAEAITWQFASVCVNSCWTAYCAKLLEHSPVKVCTVVGFPLGAMAPEIKAAEAAYAVAMGSDEIDMVINIGWLKAGEDELVKGDIKLVKEACGEKLLKVIIETCLLTEEEKIRACELSVAGGADFVKTSTGFSTGGATVDDVALMRKTVGQSVGVKASGGVRSYETAKAMIAAGATRLGTSNGIAIMEGKEADGAY